MKEKNGKVPWKEEIKRYLRILKAHLTEEIRK
jgi:hypothetical protein